MSIAINTENNPSQITDNQSPEILEEIISKIKRDLDVNYKNNRIHPWTDTRYHPLHQNSLFAVFTRLLNGEDINNNLDLLYGYFGRMAHTCLILSGDTLDAKLMILCNYNVHQYILKNIDKINHTRYIKMLNEKNVDYYEDQSIREYPQKLHTAIEDEITQMAISAILAFRRIMPKLCINIVIEYFIYSNNKKCRECGVSLFGDDISRNCLKCSSGVCVKFK
jgi:hypothetical protein